MDFLNAAKGLWLTARDIIPITAVLILFQIFVLKSPIKNLKTVVAGILMSVIGLFLFIQGLKFGLLPLGDSVGASLPALKNKGFIVLIFFIMGYTTTLAEPSLASMAMEIEEISVGAMNNRIFVHTVALGVGIGMGVGAFKILKQIPSTYIIVPLIIGTAVLAYFSPERITGIAFDCAGVTTGPVTVPINMALAIGLSSIMGGSDPLIDGFGIIGLAALGPIITVLLLGTLTRF